MALFLYPAGETEAQRSKRIRTKQDWNLAFPGLPSAESSSVTGLKGGSPLSGKVSKLYGGGEGREKHGKLKTCPAPVCILYV